MADGGSAPSPTFRDQRGEESGEVPVTGVSPELVRRAESAGVLLHGALGTPADLDRPSPRTARPQRRPDDALNRF